MSSNTDTRKADLDISLAKADKSKPFIPLASVANDGYSKEDEATATCFCGAVQCAFPTSKPGLAETFVCHCYDCHKLTASMFASNFCIKDGYLKFIRGKENLTAWSNSTTIVHNHTMTNYFCKTCGSLMYRMGSNFPGLYIMRIGTIDDFNLHETKFKPRIEQFTKDRVSWLSGVEGVEESVWGSAF